MQMPPSEDKPSTRTSLFTKDASCLPRPAPQSALESNRQTVPLMCNPRPSCCKAATLVFSAFPFGASAA